MVNLENKTIKTDKSICYLLEEDVFYVEYFAGAQCDVDEFVHTSNAFKELGNNQPIKILALFPEFTNITPQAREYLQTRENVAGAEAIVFNSLAQRLIFNFYKFIRQKKYPVKGFTSQDAALEWLKSL